jgi:hypothetical protein
MSVSVPISKSKLTSYCFYLRRSRVLWDEWIEIAGANRHLSGCRSNMISQCGEWRSYRYSCVLCRHGFDRDADPICISPICPLTTQIGPWHDSYHQHGNAHDCAEAEFVKGPRVHASWALTASLPINHLYRDCGMYAWIVSLLESTPN